jgi:hypothetical protein
LAVVAAKISAADVATAWDSATLHIKDVEDHAGLEDKEALERVSWVEAENSTALTSVREDVEGLALKITLLEDELKREHRGRETFEREHRACFEELTLLYTRGSELCHAIIGPPWAKHLSWGMRLVALRHTEVAGELAAFWVAMSSTTELVLGWSLGNIAHTEEVGELDAEF